MRGKEVKREGCEEGKKRRCVCERERRRGEGGLQPVSPFIGGRERENKSILDSQRKEAMH